MPVTRIIFDVLRRALLEDLGLEVPGSVQVPPAFPGDAAALLAATRDQDLGGNRAQASRVAVPLRTAHPRMAQDPKHPHGPGAGRRLAPRHRRAPEYSRFSAHGLRRPGALEFAGTVGSGLSMAELREVTALLESVEQPVSPFTGPLPPDITRQARWTRLVLAAEVTYLERTPSGRGAPAGLARPEAGLAANSRRAKLPASTGQRRENGRRSHCRGGQRAPDVLMLWW